MRPATRSRDADALLVVDDGKPAAVLTRHDLLTFLGA